MKTVVRNTNLIMLIVIIVGMFAGAVSADPTAWNAFQPSSYMGITLSQQFVTSLNPVTYTLTLSDNPKVWLGGEWYNVTMVWGVFAVATESAPGVPYKFEASVPAKTGWDIDVWPKTAPYANAGWWNPSKDYGILPSGSDTFTFDSLQIDGTPVVLGLHVSLDRQYNGTFTLPVKETGRNFIPEPSSLVGLILALTSTASLIIRRK